ncbi:DNA replication protein DnaC [Granulicatella balaenopterae]|uniref:DNA replication protein DnaC n=2 Tax=Granulicatella balaenopterae TaxID=137733 RepID=A0A1H9PRM2_9LACT|nr:DNA replication protein DnaC [Granulicatella balaenopterae]
MNIEMQKYIKVKNNLEELKLKQMHLHLDDAIEQYNSGNSTLTELLLVLTNYELKAKEERMINSCVRIAGFPYLKTTDDFDFNFQPSINKKQILGFKDMRFVDNKENILFIGNPGVGKTHLATSIGIEAAKNRRSTYFVSCNDLIMQLKKALLENRLEQRLKYYARMKLLIIDEVGYLPLDDVSSKLFFQLIAKRYEKNSTIITANKPLSEWTETFGDIVIANAILDRLLHHSHVIKIIGPSYRTKNILPKTNENTV